MSWSSPNKQVSLASIESLPVQHNAAASLSLLCAVLAPVGFFLPVVISLISDSHGLPEVVAFFATISFLCAPFVGVFAGHIGLYQARKKIWLRGSRWVAMTALALNYIWLIGVLFIVLAEEGLFTSH